MEAMFSVLRGASLRGSALADSRTSQKNLLLVLLCLRTTLRSSGSSEDSCFFSEGFLWKILGKDSFPSVFVSVIKMQSLC